MLSGGEALESRAVSRAGDVLEALARRMPTVAHRKTSTGLTDLPLAELTVGDVIIVLPHEICPVDGTVVAGRGTMDESYLTGEPYHMAKAPGSTVLSGAINGQAVLEIRTDRVGSDSRYAKIMDVLAESQQTTPGCGGWPTSSAGSTRRWPWRSRLPPGGPVAARPGFWRCSSWPRPARC